MISYRTLTPASRPRLVRHFGLLLLLGVAFTCSAKESGDNANDDERVSWEQRAVPGPAVILRVKRTIGKSLIYEGKLMRSQQGPSSYNESGTFYLNVLCTERQGKLDQMAFLRTYTDRKRSEKLENGKELPDRPLMNTTDLISLGPNYTIVGTTKCYAFDDQNRAAYRSEQMLTLKDGRTLVGQILSESDDEVVFLTHEDKIDVKRSEIAVSTPVPLPHIFINESPHYFFPIFSSRQVAPGDTWRFKVPVLVPIEQGQTARVLPTQFNISMIGRLREVRESDGGQQAIVDYRISGAFDSSDPEYASRFPAAFVSANQIVHKLTGTGVLLLDVNRGRILSKDEDCTVVLYGASLVKKDSESPPVWQKNTATVHSHFEMKLVPPGTTLKSGAVVPDYD